MFVPRNQLEACIPWLGRRMIFVHTPKCAGSFVARAFGSRFKRCITLKRRELRGHLTFSEYSERFQDIGLDLGGYVTFSAVRNPWAWHVSWYTYIKGDTGGRRSGHAVEHELFQTMPFETYITTLDDPEVPRSPQGYITRQVSDWFVDTQGKVAVDYVLRTENLVEDFELMRQQEGLHISLPSERVNVSNTQDFREFYNDQTIEIVRNRHARDLSLFGYTFE